MCTRFLMLDMDDFNKKSSAWSKRYHTADGITAVIKVIQNLCEDREFEKRLNSNHHLLPLKEGTVFDIRTGHLRPRTMTDYFSMCMNFCFIEDAVTVNTEEKEGRTRFVDVLIHDSLVEEVAERINEIGCNDATWSFFMWQFLGYCFTGFTQDRSFAMFQGLGSNGKSGLVAAMSAAMGSFFSTCAQDFFTISGTRQSAENASPMMRALQWVRCLVVAETSSGCKLSMPRIKSLTGPDEQKCRGLYAAPTIFTPMLKLIFVSNFCLEIDCSDQAAKDRYLAILFAQRYVRENPGQGELLADTEKCNSLSTTLLDAFGTWMCFGAHCMYLETNSCAVGIVRPPCIADFVKKQLEDADIISAFIYQETEKGPTYNYLAVDMWQHFCTFAKNRRSELQDIVFDAFLQQVQSKSFQHIRLKKRADKANVFIGIRKRRMEGLPMIVADDDLSSDIEEFSS
jgi:phage/plasmid-associated DNA primase